MTSISQVTPAEGQWSRRRRDRRPSALGGFGGLGRALPFLAPGLLLYTVFVLYPVGRAIFLSFYEWNGFGPRRWVGLQNFTHLFTVDPVFHKALTNSIIWTVLSLIVPNLIGFTMAVVLNGRIKARIFLRTAFYAPAVLATVIVAMSWNLFYDPSVGLFNVALRGVGLESLIRPWLGNPTYALFAVFVAAVWQASGISMILFLAGLQSVSPELVESASLDGANRWNILRHVEIPALRPTIAIVAVLSVINALKAFDIIYAMTGGGPGDSTQVLASLAWTQAIVNHNYGPGSAIAVVLLVVSLAALVPYIRFAYRDLG